MSPTTAAHGRPFNCTATTAPLRTRRNDRSTPAIRGGHRKPGATSPRRRTSRPMVRAAWAKSIEVLLTGMGSVSRRGVTRGLCHPLGSVGIVDQPVQLNPAQQRTLALLRRSGEPTLFDVALVDDIR